MKYSLILVFLVFVWSTESCKTDPKCNEFHRVSKAVVNINGTDNGKTITGLLEILESKAAMTISGTIKGLAPYSEFTLVIHMYGDLSNNCAKTGDHYDQFDRINTQNNNSKEHVGDLGRVFANKNGDVVVNIKDRRVKLSGYKNIVGRSVVLHAQKVAKSVTGDNLVACGVIGIVTELFK